MYQSPATNNQADQIIPVHSIIATISEEHNYQSYQVCGSELFISIYKTQGGNFHIRLRRSRARHQGELWGGERNQICHAKWGWSRIPIPQEKQLSTGVLPFASTFLNTQTLRKQKSHLPLASFERKVFISNKQAEPLHRRRLSSSPAHLSSRQDLEPKDELWLSLCVYTSGTNRGFLVT